MRYQMNRHGTVIDTATDSPLYFASDGVTAAERRAITYLMNHGYADCSFEEIEGAMDELVRAMNGKARGPKVYGGTNG